MHSFLCLSSNEFILCTYTYSHRKTKTKREREKMLNSIRACMLFGSGPFIILTRILFFLWVLYCSTEHHRRSYVLIWIYVWEKERKMKSIRDRKMRQYAWWWSFYATRVQTNFYWIVSRNSTEKREKEGPELTLSEKYDWWETVGNRQGMLIVLVLFCLILIFLFDNQSKR